jgi:hypothetical protein
VREAENVLWVRCLSAECKTFSQRYTFTLHTITLHTMARNVSIDCGIEVLHEIRAEYITHQSRVHNTYGIGVLRGHERGLAW